MEVKKPKRRKRVKPPAPFHRRTVSQVWYILTAMEKRGGWMTSEEIVGAVWEMEPLTRRKVAGFHYWSTKIHSLFAQGALHRQGRRGSFKWRITRIGKAHLKLCEPPRLELIRRIMGR